MAAFRNRLVAAAIALSVAFHAAEALGSCLLNPVPPFAPPSDVSQNSEEVFGDQDQNRTQFWHGGSWSALITTHICDEFIVDISLVASRHAGSADPRATILTLYDDIASQSAIAADIPDDLRRGVLGGRQMLEATEFSYEIGESDFHDILRLRYRSPRF
jgi:hypothetical protein